MKSIDSNVRGHARPSDQKKGQLFVFRLSRDKIKIFGPSSGKNNRVSREDVELLWFYVFVGWQNFVMTVESKSGIRGHSADSCRFVQKQDLSECQKSFNRFVKKTGLPGSWLNYLSVA